MDELNKKTDTKILPVRQTIAYHIMNGRIKFVQNMFRHRRRVNTRLKRFVNVTFYTDCPCTQEGAVHGRLRLASKILEYYKAQVERWEEIVKELEEE